MKRPSHVSGTLREILAGISTEDELSHDLESFWTELAERPFLPLAGRLLKLRTADALFRFADLRAEVRARLERRVQALWNAFPRSAGQEPGEGAAAGPVGGSGTDAEQQPQMGPDPESTEARDPAGASESSESPKVLWGFSRFPEKPDWFDRMLDVVASMIGAAGASRNP